MSTATPSLPLSPVVIHAIADPTSTADRTSLAPETRSASELAGFSVSAATDRLRSQIRTVGPHYRTALILGERGARKEEVARSLHAASPVAKGPFVVCDSGWLETLLRSSGSGNAISHDREICRSLARAGQGGTIFFPELGLFSSGAQREVLRLLEGLQQEKGQRVRVIASVSGDVQAMVAGGVLLSELRERFGTVELTVAPLRERLGDFAVIVRRMLGQIALRSGRETTTISEGALKELQRRGWPGNYRELESALCMATLTSGGTMIEESHLPPATEMAEQQQPAGPATSSMRLQEVMDKHVKDVLERCDGNKLKAAEVLGISRSTLYRMLDAASVAY